MPVNWRKWVVLLGYKKREIEAFLGVWAAVKF